MDPLSITVSVLAIVGRSITTIQACQKYVSKYQAADLSMTSMRTECSAIKVALAQIERLITRDKRRNVADRFEDYVLEEHDSVLNNCLLTFNILNEHLSALGLDREGESNESSLLSKIKFIWNEPQMETLRGNIRGQANAIGILLLAFQAEKTSRTYSLMRNEKARRSFARVSNDANSLRRSLSVSNNSSRDSATADSARWDEDFLFDNIVLNTTVYRKAFIKQQSKTQLREENNEGHTSPKREKSPLSIHSEETMRGPAPDVIPEESPLNLTAPQLAPLPDFGSSFTYQLDPPATEFPQVMNSGKQVESVLPLQNSIDGSQKVAETRPNTLTPHLKSHVKSPGATTSYTPQPSVVAKIQINEQLSPQQTPSGKAGNSAASTQNPIAQPQSEQLPSFKDYYSQDEILPGNLISVLWAYQPRASDEFSLERGDVLRVVGLWDDGWGTAVMIDTRADDLKTQIDTSSSVIGEIKAFPLVCVCLPQHWRKTIEGDGSTAEALVKGEDAKVHAKVAELLVESTISEPSMKKDSNDTKRSLSRNFLKTLRARQKVYRKRGTSGTITVFDPTSSKIS